MSGVLTTQAKRRRALFRGTRIRQKALDNRGREFLWALRYTGILRHTFYEPLLSGTVLLACNEHSMIP